MSKLSVLNGIRKFPPLYDACMWILDINSWLKSRRRGSFSQHGEDAFVDEYFAHRKDGFYLDIGASHPFKLSNTYLLYRQGWKGVTVEPIPRLGNLHRKWRPKDDLLPIAVGFKRDTLDFFEMTPSVLSTLDPKVAEQYIADGQAVLCRRYKIDVLPINEIIERVNSIAKVNFFSIDIEGLDAAVLAEIDYSKFRPDMICVEANSPEVRAKTQLILANAGYDILKEIDCNLMAVPREAKRAPASRPLETSGVASAHG